MADDHIPAAGQAPDQSSLPSWMSKVVDVCRPISTFNSDAFAEVFSARAMDRGGLFAMEGFIDELSVSLDDKEGVTVQGRCYASFSKNVRRRVECKLGKDSGKFTFVDSSCVCTAGANKCAHAAGLLLYVAKVCGIIRAMEDDEDEEQSHPSPAQPPLGPDQAASVAAQSEALPPTSKPRAWGLPAQKRKVVPTEPMEELQYSSVSLEKDFSATRTAPDATDPRVPSQRTVRPDAIKTLVGNLKKCSQESGKPMVLLDYVGTILGGTAAVANELTCPYDAFRPKPLRLPARFEPLWAQQAQHPGEPTHDDVLKWVNEFMRLLPVRRDDVEVATRDQAFSDQWYLERVCRITASRVGSVVTRQRHFQSLASQLLYQSPPTNLPSLRFGRDNEDVAVELYCKTYPDRLVQKCGLYIHPTCEFIAASPDRLVNDAKHMPSEGLLEVKCLFAANQSPQDAAKDGKVAYLKVDGDVCRLNTSHKYYHQIQCQMACAERSWCDLVVFSVGKLFCQRIEFDHEKWCLWEKKVEKFYLDTFVPELVYPKH